MTNNFGLGGNLSVSAKGNMLVDGGRVLTRTLGRADAGTLTVNAGNLTLINGGQIFVGIGNASQNPPGFAEGTGKGGNVAIRVDDTLSISGTDVEGFQSGIFSNAQIGKGDTGNVSVSAAKLHISNGGAISADTHSSGNSGNLQIKASDLFLSGTGLNGLSRISADAVSTEANEGITGDAGNITINVDRLEMQDSAQLSTSTSTSGRGGNLTVIASEDIRIIRSPAERVQTGLFSNSNESGQGGNLTISAGGSTVVEGGRILTRTLGKADAGILAVKAKNLTLSE